MGFEVFLISIPKMILIVHSDHISDSWIFVSNDQQPSPDNENEICGEIKVGGFAHIISCNYNRTLAPRRGRYVVIRRKDTATVWIGRLNFCEVEVFSCPPGKWGVNVTDPAVDCSRSCNCKPEETCSVATGRNSDCLLAECSGGWWGENCEKMCRCAKKCHRNTGYCDEAGCAEGYAGPLTCSTGLYSSNRAFPNEDVFCRIL